jgi:WD40 repeat protein
MSYQNCPFYSLDVNKNMICAGTNSEIIFWDLRKLKVAQAYQSSHTDDVTALCFNPTNPNWLLSCSTDNLLCHFDFEGKPSLSEDDTLEGVYASE